jgi:hypothetical protein
VIQKSYIFLGTIQQIALTFSITSSFFKVLSKAKDKYPEFKYIDIIVFYGKDCFSNIKTSSKRLEYLNIFPSFFKKFNTSCTKKYFNSICVIILLMLKLVSNKIDTFWRHCDIMSVICFLYFVEFCPRYFDGFLFMALTPDCMHWVFLLVWMYTNCI